MSIWHKAASVAMVVALAACSDGGSGSDDDERAAYTIAAVPYQVDGSEAELDASAPDAALAAALSAIAASSAVLVGDLGSLDHGAAPPGRGEITCHAGSLHETIVESSGERDVTLSASQCFDRASDGVQDGIVEVAYTRPSAGEAEGNLALGSETSSFLAGLPDVDDDDYQFRQARGHIVFTGEFDGSPGASTVSGLSVVFGKGPRPVASGAVFTPGRSIEILAGAPGDELNVTGSSSGGTTHVDLSGRFSVAGTGTDLDPGCAFEASFHAVTNQTMQIGTIDRIIRNGMLTISTSGGSATVEFDASGNASVDVGAGAPQTYSVNIVRNFCVF